MKPLVALALLLATANPSYGYLKFGVNLGNRDVTLRDDPRAGC